jgi:hypothetical protein
LRPSARILSVRSARESLADASLVVERRLEIPRTSPEWEKMRRVKRRERTRQL